MKLNNKKIIITFLVTIMIIFTLLFTNAANVTSTLPQNPFGIGVAYQVTDYATQFERDAARVRQMEQAKYLTGDGGHVRIWCFMGTQMWYKPYTDGPTECALAVKKAHDLNLVPVVVISDLAVLPADTTINSKIGALDFSPARIQAMRLVQKLPIPAGRKLWIELANEPNWTSWWMTGTCSPVIRAIEIVRQSRQIATGLRSLAIPGLKIAFASLASYSDSNPVPDSNGKCFTNGTKLDLPAYQFVKWMREADPTFFSAVLLDAWNSHAYNSSSYNQCSIVGTPCVAASSDVALVDYKKNLEYAGLPANFPVLITETGHLSGSSTAAADYFATKSANGVWSGALPNVWLPKRSDNNVIGIMGYVLQIPGDTYSWIQPNSQIQTALPYQVTNPIFDRVRALRIETLSAWQATQVSISDFSNMIYRLYNYRWDFVFTPSLSEVTQAQSNGYKLQFGAFKLYAESATGRTPVYRCAANTSTSTINFLSIDGRCEGHKIVFIIGFLDTAPSTMNTPLYRCYGGSGDSLIFLETTSLSECTNNPNMKLQFSLGYVPK